LKYFTNPVFVGSYFDAEIKTEIIQFEIAPSANITFNISFKGSVNFDIHLVNANIRISGTRNDVNSTIESIKSIQKYVEEIDGALNFGYM
jgi:hypothetical protein